MVKRLLSLLVLGVLAAATASHAAIITYYANLDGPSEAPPNASPGTGFAQIDIDDVALTMRVRATFSGLQSAVTNAHIHCCTALPLAGTAGVATTTPTFAGFPSGVTSGSYDNTLDLTSDSSWNAAFLDPGDNIQNNVTIAKLAAGLAEGRAYFNIHTAAFPAGEIRGFLQVPEPGTLALLGLGIAGLAAARRHKR